MEMYCAREADIPLNPDALEINITPQHRIRKLQILSIFGKINGRFRNFLENKIEAVTAMLKKI